MQIVSDTVHYRFFVAVSHTPLPAYFEQQRRRRSVARHSGCVTMVDAFLPARQFCQRRGCKPRLIGWTPTGS
jgi:hypothetical protein